MGVCRLSAGGNRDSNPRFPARTDCSFETASCHLGDDPHSAKAADPFATGAEGWVVAQGRWDARGTLGVDREAPVGLTDIALTFELDTDADAATVQRLVEMSERFCVIYQTLRAPPRLTVTHRTATDA
jgi:hypothetical protein